MDQKKEKGQSRDKDWLIMCDTILKPVSTKRSGKQPITV